VSHYECIATDPCGHSVECSWDVEISGQNTLEVDVQLSPTMYPGLISRCIEFELYSSCAEAPIIVMETLDFGGPFNLPGRATGVSFKVPAGQYVCVTARDPLHTLRSVAMTELIDGRFVARFVGDPFFDGNWLVGGNLDGSNIIDILDFGVLVSQYLTTQPADTPCDSLSAPNADINGDGLVNEIDMSFIMWNYLEEDKDSCCPDPIAGSSSPPVLSITVRELREMGRADLTVADVNRDGVLDQSDIADFLENGVPSRERAKKPLR
jgi:hypothetical protein